MALKASIAELSQELAAYYRTIAFGPFQSGWDVPEGLQQACRSIWETMDRYAADHPDEPPCSLKARLHEEIADRFEPVVFRQSPFFWEMGLRPAQNWGTPTDRSAASWMRQRRHGACRATEAYQRCLYFSQFEPKWQWTLWYAWDVFDIDHHSLGNTELLRTGLKGTLQRIDQRLSQPADADQLEFLHAARRSVLSVLKIAGKFADRARQMLAAENDPKVRASLARIADAATHIPANPPRTFHEGLAMLWFMREVSATLESIGISVIGHPDRQLIGLYRADLAAGRINEAEAADLLARWMVPTDIKFQTDTTPWPETSTCMELGGCDEDGHEVFNELTRLILRTHQDLGLMSPKPNCRVSGASSQEYLDLISRSVLDGHNVFALLNDDVLIPACMRSGKELREARLYVNGGCQETIVEGVEHSAGAYYYFNMARVLDLCLLPVEPRAPELIRPELDRLAPSPVADPFDFEAFYCHFMDALTRMIAFGAEWRAEAGALYPEIQPCPLFSTTLKGCIENARDYTAGGAKYNPACLALIGLATVVDSLLAIRRAVFEERWLTLAQLREALAANWQGHEDLRNRLVALPKFGHANAEADALATRLSEDLVRCVDQLRNERGGPYQASFFVYYAFRDMGQRTRATPDGRRAGEFLSQGCGPSRIRPPTSLTDAIRSLQAIDFTKLPGNSVLDVQLPMARGLQPAALSAVIRTFAQTHGPTLQPTCVRIEDLKDAQVHPERHRDLTVRICGLSARFVALNPDVQNEIMGRALMGM